MNAFALSGLLTIISCLTMSIMMFWKGTTRPHRLWALFCLSVAIWGGGVYTIGQTTDVLRADMWWRITHIGVIFIPVFFVHFVYAFLELKDRVFITLLYILGGVFLLANFTGGLFIANMRWVFNQFYYDSPPGPLYVLFSLFFIVMVLYGHIKVVQATRKASGVRRLQLKLFLIGTALGFLGGGVSFLPVFGIDWYPFFNFAVPIGPLVVGYTMLRYRLMDVRIAVRKGFVYFTVALFTYFIFFSAAYLFENSVGSLFTVRGFILGMLMAILYIIALFFVRDMAITFANRFLYSNIYNAQKTLRETAAKITTIVDLDDLAETIMDTIVHTLHVGRIALMVKVGIGTPYNVLESIEFPRSRIRALMKDPFLLKLLEHNKEAVVRDELQMIASESVLGKSKQQYQSLGKRMDSVEVALVLPLITKGELFGAIVLGEKGGHGVYSREDIELLEILASQVANALENALLYDHMEEIVAEQTKNLRKKNIHLEKLLKMRSEFLNIASHQFRTPISVIKGYISMMEEGDYDITKKEVREEVYEAISEKTDKLDQIVNDILYASELDTGSFVLHKEDLKIIDLVPYMKDVVRKHQKEAKRHEVRLSLQNIPTSSVYGHASERYLGVVLHNLLINALHYTLKGGKITLSIELKKEVVRIAVEDTGIGIPKADQKHIFAKFNRGKNANHMHTDGSGLGLFIVKHMIKAHPKGRVGFTSKVNKGTTFWIELERVEL